MQKFISNGNDIKVANIGGMQDTLPKYIYGLQQTLTGFILSGEEPKFLLPKKIYGEDQIFVNRALKTFNVENGNLGIIFSGIKGTGKTVTSKMIANQSDIPVIIVRENFGEAFVQFISSIKQDLCIFIDEFEKIFQQHSDEDQLSYLLTMLDGGNSNGFKRLFLFTTNDADINRYLQDRPGRIRYHKKYGNMSVDLIREVVDDLLVNPDLRECTVKGIASLSMITMDIVTKVINEVNIHDEDPVNFFPYFNIEVLKDQYNLFEISGEEEQLISSRVSVMSSDKRIYINGQNKGEILEKKVIIDKVNVIYTVKENISDGFGQDKYVTKVYRVEKVDTQHPDFVKYGKYL